MILEESGIAGVCPTHFSWRDIRIMATARLTAEWDQVSAVLCAIGSLFRDTKKAPLDPEDFNPFRRKLKQLPELRTGQEVVDTLRGLGIGK